MIKSHMVRPEIENIGQKKAWNCKGKDFCAENYSRKAFINEVALLIKVKF